VDVFGGRCLAESSIFENGKAAEGGGEYYSNARWYDPTLGRFITEDPARDGVNWYAYCGNNPLTHTDPTGLMDVGQVFGGLGSMLLGLVIGGATLVEDAATGGVGVLDDPATLALAGGLIAGGAATMSSGLQSKAAPISLPTISSPTSTAADKIVLPKTDDAKKALIDLTIGYSDDGLGAQIEGGVIVVDPSKPVPASVALTPSQKEEAFQEALKEVNKALKEIGVTPITEKEAREIEKQVEEED
jgi:RHS repeat-associated protein